LVFTTLLVRRVGFHRPRQVFTAVRLALGPGQVFTAMVFTALGLVLTAVRLALGPRLVFTAIDWF
jgi:hypothetical protein